MSSEFLYKTKLTKTWIKLSKSIKSFDTAYKRCCIDACSLDYSVLFLVHNVNGHSVKMAIIRDGKTTVYTPTKGGSK